MTDSLSMKDYGFHRIIKYTGVFDFDGLYKYCHKWIATHDFDVYETDARDRPPYKVYVIWGRKKVTFFAMLTLNIELWLWDDKPVEVFKDGKQQTLTEGRLKLVVNGGYIIDYDGDFERSAFLKKVENFLHNYVMYHDILLKYFDYMDYYLYDFMTDIKKFIGMETATNAY